MKNSKTVKLTAFFLKTVPRFSSIIYFFFPLNNSKKALYANVPEMFKFNPKIIIPNYPIICSCCNAFSTNVSDSSGYFTSKNLKL
jgi:hypothetical protein